VGVANSCSPTFARAPLSSAERARIFSDLGAWLRSIFLLLNPYKRRSETQTTRRNKSRPKGSTKKDFPGRDLRRYQNARRVAFSVSKESLPGKYEPWRKQLYEGGGWHILIKTKAFLRAACFFKAAGWVQPRGGYYWWGGLRNKPLPGWSRYLHAGGNITKALCLIKSGYLQGGFCAFRFFAQNVPCKLVPIRRLIGIAGFYDPSIEGIINKKHD